MSRRRAPRKPFTRSELETTVLVICTGRDTHRPRRLDRIAVWTDGIVQLDDAGLNLVPDEPRRVPRFHCRSCRRDVPVRMERLELLARKLAERGVDRLDISALSAICYPGKQ